NVQNLPQRACRAQVDVVAEHLAGTSGFFIKDRLKRLDDEALLCDAVLRHCSEFSPGQSKRRLSLGNGPEDHDSLPSTLGFSSPAPVFLKCIRNNLKEPRLVIKDHFFDLTHPVVHAETLDYVQSNDLLG